MRTFQSVVAVTLMALVSPKAVAQEDPRVVAVNYPLQYFAERLMGDAAEVVFPVPEGVDPSFWRPSIADISMIQSADLILLNGAGFATWVDRVSLPRARLANTSTAIEDRFIVTESVTHSHGDGGEHSHEGLASYTWLDPTLAIAQAEAVAAAITARDLAPANDVSDRLAALRTELEALDAEAANALSEAQRVPLIATHPRYQYFADRYGLSITSLEWQAGAMPTSEELAELEALAAETGAGVMIWEAEPPSAAIDAASALGLESVVIETLASGTSGGTYLSAFEASVSALSDAVAQSD